MLKRQEKYVMTILFSGLFIRYERRLANASSSSRTLSLVILSRVDLLKSSLNKSFLTFSRYVLRVDAMS